MSLVASLGASLSVGLCSSFAASSPASELPRPDGSIAAEPAQDQGVASGSEQSQPASKQPTPLIVLPKAISTPVTFPPNARGAAQVQLELTIDVEGRATDPHVLDGAEPYASAALAAVSKWRFIPASRDGKSVLSKIRFLVRFTPPESTAPVTAVPAQRVDPVRRESSVAKRPIAAAPSRAAPIEVTVTGDRPEAAVISMGRADVEQMPGAFGDPFRAIDALPGVVPIVSGLPFFFIRGAPPGNQGYFLDGIRVPLLYHMAAGPGVIHPALVDRVDLYAGGYPARYGRFAGAIVAGESRDPAPEFHAQGSVRLVDSGAYLTAPLGRGAIALGGRYSYTAAVVSLIAPEVKIDYWDYQAKAVQYLSDRDTLGIFAFGALDLLQDKSSSSPEAYVGTEFHRVDLRYQRTFGKASRLRTALTLGLDKTLAAAAMTVRDRLVAMRSDYEQHFGVDATFRAGIDAAADHYDVIIPVPDGSNVHLRQAIPERQDYAAGVWTDLSFRASRGVTLVPGMRLDQYWSGSDHSLALEPRISAIFAVRNNLRLVHALGLAHQPPSFIVPIPGFQPSGLKAGLQRSVQSSAGLELDLPKDITVGATVFQNAFFNLTDQLSALNRPNMPEGDDEIDPGLRSRGRTFGLELLLRRSFSHRIGGLLAYTLSKSWRTTDGVRVPAAFDRRHVLQAALAFNLGRNWRSSVRGVFYSGVPSFNEEYSSATTRPDGTVEVVQSERRNPEHLPRAPGYYRLDLRLQKRWPVGNRGAHWALTFEVLNTTLNRETIQQACKAGDCRSVKIGPITIPSIGVEAAY